MDLVIYGDFNCPFSALASRRVARLERAGQVRVEWRAVEHDPDIPTSGQPVQGPLADEIERELEQVRGLLLAGEILELRRPAIRPNTAAAIDGYAAADPRRRPALRAELFDRYWGQGQDLTDDEVLAEIGLTEGAPDTAARWRDEWLAAGKPIVPMMRLPDGYVSRGLGALKRLAELLGE